jgi:hypothetical protein
LRNPSPAGVVLAMKTKITKEMTKDARITTKRTAPRCLAALACLLAAGCGPELTADPDVESDNKPIWNGTAFDPNDSGHVLVRATRQCSGSLINNSWFITAKHCGTIAYQTTVSHGREGRSAVQVVDHPEWDISLVRVNVPFNIRGSTTSFVRRMHPFGDMMSRDVNCYGYGRLNADPNTAEVARVGAMVVNRVDFTFDGSVSRNNPGVQLVPRINGQLNTHGDSGAGCLIQTLMGESHATVQSQTFFENGDPNRTPTKAYSIPTSRFSRWALTTLFPNRAFWCQGVECLTTAASLPNNFSMNTTWNPCGGFRSKWHAITNLESGRDFFYVNGKALSGINAIHIGIGNPGTPLQLRLTTDGANPSRGVEWLRVECVQ